jgi:hypothetical protein
MHVSQTTSPYQKYFHIRSRRGLIGAILALQAVVVGWGWWGTMQFTRTVGPKAAARLWVRLLMPALAAP